jgi:hypothetical protein
MSKHKSASHPRDPDEVRVYQAEAVNMLLTTMEILGERHLTIQTELDGVVENLLIRRCTEKELNDYVKNELAQGERGRAERAAPPAPLT